MKRSIARRAASLLPIWMVGVLLFYVSGAALTAHMAAEHPATHDTRADALASHAPGEHHQHDDPADTNTPAPERPYDHARDCELGHMLHGIAAAVAPPAPVPTPALTDARPVSEGRRLCACDSHFSRRSRAPPHLG